MKHGTIRKIVWQWGHLLPLYSKSLAEAVQTALGIYRGMFPKFSFQAQKNCNRNCPECNKKVTPRSKGVECECCLNWYQVKCGDTSDDEYLNINENV